MPSGPYTYLVFRGNNASVVGACLKRRPWWKPAMTLPKELEPHEMPPDCGQGMALARADRIKRLLVTKQKEAQEECFLGQHFDFCWRSTLFVMPGPLGAHVTLHSVDPPPGKEQLVNHFSSIHDLTSKTGLLRSLQAMYSQLGEDTFKYTPTTFLVTASDAHSWRQFCDRYRQLREGKYGKETVPAKHCRKNIWIVKPSGLNCGRGIEVFDSLPKIKAHIAAVAATDAYLIQKYLEKPLLLWGRKFDIRCWALVTDNMDVYVYRDGYLRTSSEPFTLSLGENDNMVHLTNYCMQKNSENLSRFEEGNTLSYDQFQAYLDEHHGADGVNVREHILPRMHDMIRDSILSVRLKLHQGNKGRRCFELYGYDFMVDEDYRTYLIEVNTNPFIGFQNPWHEKLVTRMIEDLVAKSVDVVYPPPAGKVAKMCPALKPDADGNVFKVSNADTLTNGFELLYSEDEEARVIHPPLVTAGDEATLQQHRDEVLQAHSQAADATLSALVKERRPSAQVSAAVNAASVEQAEYRACIKRWVLPRGDKWFYPVRPPLQDRKPAGRSSMRRLRKLASSALKKRLGSRGSDSGASVSSAGKSGDRASTAKTVHSCTSRSSTKRMLLPPMEPFSLPTSQQIPWSLSRLAAVLGVVIPHAVTTRGTRSSSDASDDASAITPSAASTSKLSPSRSLRRALTLPVMGPSSSSSAAGSRTTSPTASPRTILDIGDKASLRRTVSSSLSVLLRHIDDHRVRQVVALGGGLALTWMLVHRAAAIASASAASDEGGASSSREVAPGESAAHPHGHGSSSITSPPLSAEEGGEGGLYCGSAASGFTTCTSWPTYAHLPLISARAVGKATQVLQNMSDLYLRHREQRHLIPTPPCALLLHGVLPLHILTSLAQVLAELQQAAEAEGEGEGDGEAAAGATHHGHDEAAGIWHSGYAVAAPSEQEHAITACVGRMTEEEEVLQGVALRCMAHALHGSRGQASQRQELLLLPSLKVVLLACAVCKPEHRRIAKEALRGLSTKELGQVAARAAPGLAVLDGEDVASVIRGVVQDLVLSRERRRAAKRTRDERLSRQRSDQEREAVRQRAQAWREQLDAQRKEQLQRLRRRAAEAAAAQSAGAEVEAEEEEGNAHAQVHPQQRQRQRQRLPSARRVRHSEAASSPLRQPSRPAGPSPAHRSSQQPAKAKAKGAEERSREEQAEEKRRRNDEAHRKWVAEKRRLRQEALAKKLAQQEALEKAALREAQLRESMTKARVADWMRMKDEQRRQERARAEAQAAAEEAERENWLRERKKRFEVAKTKRQLSLKGGALGVSTGQGAAEGEGEGVGMISPPSPVCTEEQGQGRGQALFENVGGVSKLSPVMTTSHHGRSASDKLPAVRSRGEHGSEHQRRRSTLK